jgi:hypothetical protein
LDVVITIQCRLVSENRLPCPSGQAGTTHSLTVTLSVVEGCLHPTFIENLSKLNDIELRFENPNMLKEFQINYKSPFPYLSNSLAPLDG